MQGCGVVQASVSLVLVVSSLSVGKCHSLIHTNMPGRRSCTHAVIHQEHVPGPEIASRGRCDVCSAHVIAFGTATFTELYHQGVGKILETQRGARD